MFCPNCQTEAKPEKVQSLVYYRCNNCQALWFDNKDSDFLTLSEAEAIKNSSPSNVVFKQQIICPNCDKQLQVLGKQQFQCYQCGGILTSATQIFKDRLKKITEAGRHSSFSKQQLRNVVVLGLLVGFIGLNYLLVKDLSQQRQRVVKAQVLGTNIRVQHLNNQQVAIFFTTEDPYYSILYLQKTDGLIKAFPINQKQPSYTHLLTMEAPKKGERVEITLLSIDRQRTQRIPLKLN
jgi:Zn-finger nucleic acid-binding protein